MQEKIDAAVETGRIDYRDTKFTNECTKLYIAMLRHRIARDTNREVERAAKVRRDTAADAQLHMRINDILSELVDELKAGWTEELLESSFAVGKDWIKWGDATVEQHQTRATMLENMAAGDLMTAAIHRQAIKDIKDAGVISLAELRR